MPHRKILWTLLHNAVILAPIAAATGCRPESSGQGQGSTTTMTSPAESAADYLRKYQGGEDGEYPLFTIDEACSRDDGPCLEVLGPKDEVLLITQGLTEDELTSLLQAPASEGDQPPQQPPEQGLALAPDQGKRYLACLPLKTMTSSLKAAGVGLRCYFAKYMAAVRESARRDARRPEWLVDYDVRVDVGGATRVKTYLRQSEERQIRVD